MKTSQGRTISWENDTLISGSLNKYPRKMKHKELLESQVDTNFEERVLTKKLMYKDVTKGIQDQLPNICSLQFDD